MNFKKKCCNQLFTALLFFFNSTTLAMNPYQQQKPVKEEIKQQETFANLLGKIETAQKELEKTSDPEKINELKNQVNQYSQQANPQDDEQHDALEFTQTLFTSVLEQKEEAIKKQKQQKEKLQEQKEQEEQEEFGEEEPQTDADKTAIEKHVKDINNITTNILPIAEEKFLTTFPALGSVDFSKM